MDPVELLDWKIILAALLGSGIVISAFRVKLSIRFDLNDIVDQVITYRREARQLRFEQECPYVFPIRLTEAYINPGFKSAFVVEVDGRYICSMCSQTGYTTPEQVSVIEEYWSKQSWKYWGDKMERRNKVAGFRVKE